MSSLTSLSPPTSLSIRTPHHHHIAHARHMSPLLRHQRRRHLSSLAAAALRQDTTLYTPAPVSSVSPPPRTGPSSTGPGRLLLPRPRRLPLPPRPVPPAPPPPPPPPPRNPSFLAIASPLPRLLQRPLRVLGQERPRLHRRGPLSTSPGGPCRAQSRHGEWLSPPRDSPPAGLCYRLRLRHRLWDQFWFVDDSDLEAEKIVVLGFELKLWFLLLEFQLGGWCVLEFALPPVFQTVLYYLLVSPSAQRKVRSLAGNPIRSLIESGFGANERSEVSLYYGARNLQRMAYQERFKEWEASGVRIIPVLSQPDDTWKGEYGYVQNAFTRAKKKFNPSSTGVVLCGQKQMAEEVTSILVAEGVSKEKILKNF
ncbi:hypothetical protein Sjap_024553 [Stephania japonica]|uniref:Oxidoreductase FAD/NAD(P)-binding domain-containing protein n=1 Tax=Stephania japonica TaxID=461633 RepID=A0AAP0EDK7_9MAGN